MINFYSIIILVIAFLEAALKDDSKFNKI